MDEEKPVSQHVANRRECCSGLSARSRNGGRKTRNHSFLDRGALAAEAQKKKSAAVTRAYADDLITPVCAHARKNSGAPLAHYLVSI